MQNHKLLQYFIFLLIFSFIVDSLSAQDQWCHIVHDEILTQQFNEACIMLEDSNSAAIPTLKRIVKEDTAYYEAWFKLGEAYHAKAILSQYDILLSSHTSFYFRKAEDCFQQSIKLCGEYKNHQAYYYLGEIYYLQNNYSLAYSILSVFDSDSGCDELFRKKIVRYKKDCEQWIFWHDNPAQITINSMDDINTTGDELKPFISHGASTLSFLKSQTALKPNSMHTTLIRVFNEAFIEGVNTLEQPIFGGITPVIHNIPVEYNIVSFRQSSNSEADYYTIQIRRSNNKVFDKDCDIYINERSNQFTGADSIINYPDAFDGEPTVSANNDLIIFVSSREGGVGGKDLYYTSKDSIGRWSEPRNMGQGINTLNDERTPFLHFDQKTLYFSSNGRFGLGGQDIYKVERINDTLWSEPENLGLPLNSYNDDLDFVVDARGNMGYFASDKLQGKGGWDIYSAILPESIAPEASILLNGKIIDETGQPTWGVDFSLVDVNTGLDMDLMFDEDKGSFSVALPNIANNYLFRVTKKGYSFTDRFFSSQVNQLMNYRTIQIFPTSEGEIFELSKLKFNKGSYLIDNKNANALNNFVDFLAANNSLHFNIYGYFDYGIKIKPNNELSKLRAKQLYDYLLKKGIEAERMSFIGKNETMSYDDLSPIKFEIISK